MQTPTKPDTPWATREVTKTVWVRRAKKPKAGLETEKTKRVVVRIEPVHKPRPTPWVPPSPPPESPRPQPETNEKPLPHTQLPRPRRAKSPHRLISAENYAAVEAGGGQYGVIDLGSGGNDTRSVILHVPRGNKEPWQVLARVRPGASLQVRTSPHAPPHSLRVRFTTPARYYSPGTKISTLYVAVDAADWMALTAGSSGI